MVLLKFMLWLKKIVFLGLLLYNHCYSFQTNRSLVRSHGSICFPDIVVQLLNLHCYCILSLMYILDRNSFASLLLDWLISYIAVDATVYLAHWAGVSLPEIAPTNLHLTRTGGPNFYKFCTGAMPHTQGVFCTQFDPFHTPRALFCWDPTQNPAWCHDHSASMPPFSK